MTRIKVGMALGLTACLALAACGGGSKTRVHQNYGGASRYAGLNVTLERRAFATGPISSACMSGGRKAANRELCGCVQAAANAAMPSGRDQRLAASFFADPHQAQVIRQSDNPTHEAFWKRYKTFTAQSETLCRGL
ncbi:arginine transporter [Sagittula salina]|uniref:Arginine transporter n=1 Tax=Sagittula salina TaxID=2820268 RepID=A0A940S2F0_9RHOB|nr:arginine transporter [Sagittula salina]MBP0484022.1 arginine transporter [Sagittula salina]